MANETLTSENEIRQALNYVDAHDREMWLRMGAGIKSELGEGGFEMWDTWSQQADSYNAKSAKSAWKSLKPGRVNIGSVFFEAKRAGYTPGKPYTPPSPEEQAAKAEKNRIAEEKALAERTVEAAQAKAEAQARWEKAGAANSKHPYLVAKGITDPTVIGSIRQDGNQLLIPLRQNKDLVALQSIGPNGFKSFAKGSQVQGSAFLIGHPKEASIEQGVLVAEGFATAASLRQATGQPVLMAVNAYNMKPVAETLTGKMPNIPVTFCADNDANGVGIKYAEQAAEIIGDKARAIMPDFTDSDVAGLQQKHGAEAMPSDFNDLAQLRGFDAVKEAVQQIVHQVEAQRHVSENPEPQEPIVSTAVFSPDEQNQIEPDLEQEIVKNPTQHNPAATLDDDVPDAGEGVPNTHQPEAEPPAAPATASLATEDSDISSKKPILDLAYKAPPDGLEVRYLFVDGKYVDSSNGVTTIFQDKGKYLATARQDIQTVHDMVEVAKVKGWDRLKLSGSHEFKRLMYIEAESQGIKTRGYQATAEDLAMVSKRQDERSLNQMRADPFPEKHPNRKGATSKADVQAASAADALTLQNELPTEAQIESSPKADVDSDVQMRDIGSPSIPSEVKIAADHMRAEPQSESKQEPAAADKRGFDQRLEPGSKVRFRYMKSMADTVISYLRHDRRADAQRNFIDNMEKAVNGSTLNVPAPMRERAPSSAQFLHQEPQIEREREPEHQHERSLEH